MRGYHTETNNGLNMSQHNQMSHMHPLEPFD